MTTATPEETGAVAEAAVVPAAGPAPKVTPMTSRDWARCRALWERGDTTYKELCARYGRSYKSFERHFKKHGIVKGAKAAALKEKVAEAMAVEDVNDAQLLAMRIKETKEEHYKMASALGRLSWNEILQAKKDGRAVSTALANLKALHAATVNLKIVREERFAILGLDRTDAVDLDQIPELIIRELTAEQIEELRKRDHTEAEDLPTTPHNPSAGEEEPEEPEDDDDAVIEEA
jgi:hypothetical protein